MEDADTLRRKLQLEHRFKAGANWFFWIAGFSLVNSIILLSGSHLNFLVGLGITQFIDAVAVTLTEGSESTVPAKVVAFAFDLFIAGFFVLFGYFARKRHVWGFIIGMVLYAADGLIFMWGKDWLSLGFHVLVLYFLFTGLRACRGLAEAERQLAQSAARTTPEDEAATI